MGNLILATAQRTLSEIVSTMLLTMAIIVAIQGTVLWMISIRDAKKAALNHDKEKEARQRNFASWWLAASWLATDCILFIGTLGIGLFPQPWNKAICIISGTIFGGIFIYAAIKTKGFSFIRRKTTDEPENDSEQ